MPVYFTRPGICATPWVANDHRGMEIDIVVKGSEPLHTPFRLDLRRHLLEGTVTEDPWKSPKMPDPKIPKFRDFYPHENWRFLSVFRLNPGRRPIFIRTIDQAKKISSPLRGPPFWGSRRVYTMFLCSIHSSGSKGWVAESSRSDSPILLVE